MGLASNRLLVNILVILNVGLVLSSRDSAFDLDLYENVLDPVKCREQLEYLRGDGTALRAQFIDASFRIPQGMLKGNTRNLGSYFQCLEIDEQVRNMDIGGKYCVVQFPLEQEGLDVETIPPFPDITWPEDWNITLPDLNITWPGSETKAPLLHLPWGDFHPETTFTDEMKTKIATYEKTKRFLKGIIGEHADSPVSRTSGNGYIPVIFELAICLPKACTVKEAMDSFSNNLTSAVTYTEHFCRLPNDKAWVPADTVAVVILSIIGLVTVLSTGYDVHHTLILQQDPKKANKYYQSFSIYTNTRNFFVFPSGPGIVTCLDGVRSFAMMWVIVGHTFVTQLSYIPENVLDMITFITKFSSLWITSATITVDTFFMISGLLVVYTTAAKISRMTLLKNLHLFYLNRLLRMFPVLAFGVLFTASFFHRTADGPYFTLVEDYAVTCRNNWWATLLYVQNFVRNTEICLPHTWYLAIDMQLHFLSPVVLFFVLGQKKKIAWLAMGTALVAFIAGASIYNFINDFQSAVVSLSRADPTYMQRYYIHTLPRAAPFFVGMLFGYLLHLYRNKKPNLHIVLVLFLWVVSICGTSLICMATYWNIQADWDNQLIDNILNSYKRPIWSACVGWIIFACHTGHGGIVNWILSWHAFKILGRLSYAMYIIHFPLIYLINATTLAPIYFAVHLTVHRFLIDFMLALIAAFLITILIDFPFANLIKMAMGPGPRRPPPKEKPSISNEEEPNFQSINLNEEEKKTRV